MPSVRLNESRILITGGHGFLGRHVVAALIAHGVPASNVSTPRSSEMDLRKLESCGKTVAGQDVVIHLAGITGNAELHRSKPGEIFYDNLMMGAQLMEAARRAGVKKFVAIGSAAEYPTNASTPLQESSLWSGYPEMIHAPYAMAKKMLLVQAQAYRQQYSFNAIHLLMTGMYGPGEHSDGGPIPSLIGKITTAERANNGVVVMWGTGTPTRDFLYVEDAAEGIVLATEKYDKPDPVNIGAGMEISIKDLTELICRLMDYHGEIRWDQTKPDGQPRRMLDVSRADKEFGFRARTPLEAGLRKTIGWYNAQT